LLVGHKISAEQRAWIEAQLAFTNPFEMKKKIEEELCGIWELASELDRKEAQKWESDLAEEGPLVSPSSARGEPKNQAAIVSSQMREWEATESLCGVFH